MAGIVPATVRRLRWRPFTHRIVSISRAALGEWAAVVLAGRISEGFRLLPGATRLLSLLVLAAFFFAEMPLLAATLHWDTNGTTAGSGDSTLGGRGTSNFWNTDSTGANGGTFQTSPTIADDVVISADSNAMGARSLRCGWAAGCR